MNFEERNAQAILDIVDNLVDEWKSFNRPSDFKMPFWTMVALESLLKNTESY